MGRARQLASGARALADRFQLDEVELLWAEGLLGRWDGRGVEAAAALERAALLAAGQDDGQREHGAQVALLMLDLESGRPAAVIDRCQRLLPLSRKLGATEVAQVEALAALGAAAAGQPGALSRLEQPLAELRALDSKAQLSYALAIGGGIARAQGATGLAGRLAAEGLAVAEVMELHNEAGLAAAVLARVALAEGDAAGARRYLQPWLAGHGEADSRSAFCQQVMAEAIRALDPSSKPGPKIGEVA